jgi:hypothetical protein
MQINAIQLKCKYKLLNKRDFTGSELSLESGLISYNWKKWRQSYRKTLSL